MTIILTNKIVLVPLLLRILTPSDGHEHVQIRYEG